MKKQTLKSSILTVFLLILLVAALAISMVSCDKKGSETEAPDTSVETTTETTVAITGDATAESTVGTTTETTAAPTETEIGEGQTSFTFKVKFKDGSERTYLVKTNSTNVGTALQDVGLISGEDGQYGLYVKTVAGETLDYDKDGKYWGLYENGTYAMSGVDTTTIKAGVVYSFEAS